MNTWTNLTGEFDLMLGDTGAVSYPSTLRMQAFNRAMQYFAITHTALFKSATASATSEGYIDYPTDILVLAGIEDSTIISNTTQWLEPQYVVPGQSLPKNGFIDMIDRYKVFGGQDTVRIWYYSLWPDIVSSSDTAHIPKWAEWALVNLSIAYMLNPNIVGQADLRRFQTKREAGSPEDNPPKTLARYYVAIYNEIIARVPLQDRAILYRAGAR